METEPMAFLEIFLQLQTPALILSVLLYVLSNGHRAQNGLFLAIVLALVSLCISWSTNTSS